LTKATPHALLERLKPDLLVKGGTYRHDEIVGWELVEGYGGRVQAFSEIPGLSTTRIVEHLRENAGSGSGPACSPVDSYGRSSAQRHDRGRNPCRFV